MPRGLRCLLKSHTENLHDWILEDEHPANLWPVELDFGLCGSPHALQRGTVESSGRRSILHEQEEEGAKPESLVHIANRINVLGCLISVQLEERHERIDDDAEGDSDNLTLFLCCISLDRSP